MLPSTCFPRNDEASSKNNQGFNGGGQVTGENDAEDDFRRFHGRKGHQGLIDCPFYYISNYCIKGHIPLLTAILVP